MSDPRILYDALSGRWFLAAMDLSRNEIDLGVSRGADPRGGFTTYTFPSTGCPDQPRLGVTENWVGFSDNLFASDCKSVTGATALGGEFYVLNKQNMLDAASVNYQHYGPSLRWYSLTPAVALSPTGGAEYFAATDALGNAIDIFAPSDLSGNSLPVQRVFVRSMAASPGAVQEGTSTTIATADTRVQNAIWESGNLYIAVNDGCLVQGEIGLHGCGRFITINTARMGLVADDEEALDKDRHLFYPAMLPDTSGNLFAVFGFSGPSDYAGVGIIQAPGNGSNWQMLSAGSAANNSGRWGDYFGIARDPSTPGRVWIAGQYAKGDDHEWGTVIAALQVNGSSTPPAVTTTTAPTTTTFVTTTTPVTTAVTSTVTQTVTVTTRTPTVPTKHVAPKKPVKKHGR